jgi:citrate synthase
MTGRSPQAEYARVIDVSLILYAEHDYNASTFTSRVIAGTLSDMHGAVTGGIAALKGPLHGGANEAAMEMLKEIRTTSRGRSARAVDDWMQKAFATKRKLMGFGHRVYKNGDHRAPILHKLGRAIAQDTKNPGHAAQVVRDRRAGAEDHARQEEDPSQRRLPVRHDVLHDGDPRAAVHADLRRQPHHGWCAHIMEQHANNRLIRPLSK